MIKIPTDDLMKSLEAAENIGDYISSNKKYFVDMSISEYLHELLKQKNLRQSDVIKRSELQQNYACQIFNGTKNATRDKLICIAIGMKLNIEETQRLLKICKRPVLYVKNDRDSIIIHAIYNKMSVVDTNELLAENEKELLG